MENHTLESTRVQATAYRALADRFHLINPNTAISSNGYVSSIDDNLLPRISRDQFEDDLRKGDGNELEAKFLAAHSSSALAVNCFASFKRDERSRKLALGGITGFNKPTFEKKCPTGLRGTSPNLDLLCESEAGVVGVESKCTEYLAKHGSFSFSSAYSDKIRDERRSGAWFKAMELIDGRDSDFLYLDVSQLIKHAFGLARSYRGKTPILLYVFWEPSNASDFPVFATHRKEIRHFEEMVSGDSPRFISMSYPELWSSWLSSPEVRSLAK